MTTKLGNIMLAIAVIISLVLSIAALGINMAEKPLKGDQGPIGLKGDTGVAGPKGDIGDTGPKGATGLTGSTGPKGSTGATGAQGPAGQNAPVNVLPVVALLDIDGNYTKTWAMWCWKYTYNFWIDISVNDPENDNLHIDFSWKTNINDTWTHKTTYIGVDGNYSEMKTFIYFSPVGNQTLYWLVETWDGSDIGLNYYNFTVAP